MKKKLILKKKSKNDYEKEEENKASNFLEKKTNRDNLICVKSIPKEKNNFKCIKSVPYNLNKNKISSISNSNSKKNLIEKTSKIIPQPYSCTKTIYENVKCMKSTICLNKKNNYEEKFDDNYSPKYYNILTNNIINQIKHNQKNN